VLQAELMTHCVTDTMHQLLFAGFALPDTLTGVGLLGAACISSLVASPMTPRWGQTALRLSPRLTQTVKTLFAVR
jgi:hypothetical protein